MTQKSLWKLVPLAVFLAAGLFMFSGSLSTPIVHADITEDLDADDSRIGDGDETQITFSADPDGGEVEISLSSISSGSSVVVTIEDCDGCDEEDNDFDDDDGSIEFDFPEAASDGDVTLTFEADCDSEDPMSLRVEQDGDSDSIEIICDPDESSTADGNVIITLDAPDTNSSFDFEISGTSTDCDFTFSLSDGDEEGEDCDIPGDYVVELTSLPSGFTLDAIDCDAEGEADFDDDVNGRSVDIELNEDDDTIECTFFIEGSGGTATPTATSTPGTPGAVTVQAVPNAVNCNGSSFITVVVRTSSGGSPVDGALVNVSTTLGSVSPGQATTSNGSILTIFTGPANSGGTATVTATSSGVSGTATIQVNCSQATAVPPTAVPTSSVPSNPGPIRPPSTGDAGLVGAEEGTGFAWELCAATTAMVGSLLGGIAVMRRRPQG